MPWVTHDLQFGINPDDYNNNEELRMETIYGWAPFQISPQAVGFIEEDHIIILSAHKKYYIWCKIIQVPQSMKPEFGFDAEYVPVKISELPTILAEDL